MFEANLVIAKPTKLTATTGSKKAIPTTKRRCLQETSCAADQTICRHCHHSSMALVYVVGRS